jgi:hypothetical protein
MWRSCISVSDLNRLTDLIFLELNVDYSPKLLTNSDFLSYWPKVNPSLHKTVNEIFHLC